MRLRLFVALIFVGITVSGCEETPLIPEPPLVVTLNIAPDPVPTLTVGQTVQLVAIVSNAPTQTVTWTSSNTSVAPVSAVGLVTCISPGIAVVTSVSTADATARDAVVVQCSAPVQATLIQIAPASLAFTHQVGTTGCPQTIGTVQVTNASSGDISVTVGVPSTLNTDVVTFALAAGASRTVTVRFNCSTQSSFAANLTFTATGGGATDVKTVQVTGTITN